ncbi:hypothetical protein C8Q77DRAFT_1092347 [Trametes polyzona]|nr:hypothetical protein C8Q77DRAFT_1092347 [Trametes polyzona]
MANTREPLVQLLSTLNDIESLMKRRAKMHALYAFFHRDDLKAEAKKQGIKLEYAFNLFSVQSAVVTRQELAQVSAAQVHLLSCAEDEERRDAAVLKNTHDIYNGLTKLTQLVSISTITTDEDGKMILRQEDVVWERELHLIDNMDPHIHVPEEDRFKLQLAHVPKREMPVIIKRFSAQSEAVYEEVIRRAKEREYLERTKKLPTNPHFIRVLGYSEPGAAHPFIVIEGTNYLTPFEDRYQTLHGSERFLCTVDIATQLSSVVEYLETEFGMSSSSGEFVSSRDLYFTSDGRTIRWDFDVWPYAGVPSGMRMADGDIYFRDPSVAGLKPELMSRYLAAADPVDRAAALLLLWGKLQFADFNREEEYAFPMREDFPWVGGCIYTITDWPRTPEGDIVYVSPDKVKYSRYLDSPRLFDFDELADELDDYFAPADTYSDWMHAKNLRYTGTGEVEVIGFSPDGAWRMHRVRGMDYGTTFRLEQELREQDVCREFRLWNAIDLDIPRYSNKGDDKEQVSVVTVLCFLTQSYVVGLGPTPCGKPPDELYFIERVQDQHSTDMTQMPWGYWSMTPTWPEKVGAASNDTEWEEDEWLAFKQKQGLEVEYLAYSEQFKFAWAQNIGGHIFRTESMVMVLSYRLTPDEMMLLDEVDDCLRKACAKGKRKHKEVRHAVLGKREELSWRNA